MFGASSGGNVGMRMAMTRMQHDTAARNAQEARQRYQKRLITIIEPARNLLTKFMLEMEQKIIGDVPLFKEQLQGIASSFIKKIAYQFFANEGKARAQVLEKALFNTNLLSDILQALTVSTKETDNEDAQQFKKYLYCEIIHYYATNATDLKNAVYYSEYSLNNFFQLLIGNVTTLSQSNPENHEINSGSLQMVSFGKVA